MDDLQLLELLEKAQKKQRGPKGETGVGIESIDQFDGQSFTLRLTDGSFKKVALQPGADGAVGPQGVQGEKGESGPAGRAGRDGKSGLDGANGLPGAPGTSLDTAIVSSNGRLLLGLSDGSVLDVGRVVGPAGATGERGPAGLPGEPGKDGAAVLSGPRPPQSDDGKDGDFWIDLSSATFGFYKKSSGTWAKLGELRISQLGQQQAAVGGGGGGGGTGGKKELQNTRTLPLIKASSKAFRDKAQAKGLPPVPGAMATQEDANMYFLDCIQNGDVNVSDTVPRPPYQEGQLWFSTNPDELTLYIYDGAVWVPAAPPVSLDGINTAIANVDAELMKVNANIAMNKRDIDEAILDVREDQDRQDGEIRSLEQEIEGIIPSYDRGTYGFTDKLQDLASSEGGHYAIVSRFVTPEEMCNTLLADCQEAAGDDVAAKSQCSKDYMACLEAIDGEEVDAPILSSKWRDAHSLWIDFWDKNEELHTFKDAKAGKYIELTNSDGTGNMVALIEEDRIEVDPGISQIKISVLSWKGEPSGDTRIKLFDISASDPTDYVKKSGDQMTGQLKITGSSKNGPLLLVEPTEAGKADYLFRVNDKAGDPVFDVHNNGQAFYERLADTDAEIVNLGSMKGYVDKEIAKIQNEEDETNARLFGSPFVFRKNKSPDSLASGEFTYDSSWNWYAHRYDAAGDRVGISSDKKFSHDGCFKVYKHNGAINLICVMHTYDTCRTGQSENDHSKWEKDESIYTHTEWLEEGKTYYLSDGFLLP
ncbi:hypothetical protein [uncultured phage MedDCM-OCT-S09-C28]|nr:hypothetical protein [uncultured phage MedDCM-OCT-S09-C28]